MGDPAQPPRHSAGRHGRAVRVSGPMMRVRRGTHMTDGSQPGSGSVFSGNGAKY
jgi:hypothetical protein